LFVKEVLFVTQKERKIILIETGPLTKDPHGPRLVAGDVQKLI